MKTVRILVFAAAVVLAVAAAAQAEMRDEPREFMGIPFGKEFEPGKAFSCETDSEEGTRCTRAGDVRSLHGVALKTLSYLFMYKRLYTVDMEVDGRDNFDKLADAITQKHGQGVRDKGGILTHAGKEVDILLFYDAPRKVGEVSYVYKNLPCPVE